MNKDVYIRSFTYIVHVIIFHEAEVGHLVKFISQTRRDICIAILRKFECFFSIKDAGDVMCFSGRRSEVDVLLYTGWIRLHSVTRQFRQGLSSS